MSGASASRSILLRAVTRLLPLLRNPRLNENVAGPQNNAHTTRRRRRIMRNVTQSKRYWAYKQQRRGRWRRRGVKGAPGPGTGRHLLKRAGMAGSGGGLMQLRRKLVDGGVYQGVAFFAGNFIAKDTAAGFQSDVDGGGANFVMG